MAGSILARTPVIDRGDIGVDAVDPGQHPDQQEAVVVVKAAGEGLLEFGDLRSHPGPPHLREHFRISFTRDERFHHRPPGHPENVRGDNGELDAGVLKEFFDPVLLRTVKAWLTLVLAGVTRTRHGG